MGLRTDPGTPKEGTAPLSELMEDVRDLFNVDSSNTEAFMPLFKLPGFGTSCDGAPFASNGSNADCELPLLS